MLNLYCIKINEDLPQFLAEVMDKFKQYFYKLHHHKRQCEISSHYSIAKSKKTDLQNNGHFRERPTMIFSCYPEQFFLIGKDIQIMALGYSREKVPFPNPHLKEKYQDKEAQDET